MQEVREIIGHKHTIERLYASLDQDRLHHAYLFEGPRGIGKSTVAIQLAMRANCEAELTLRPCHSCKTCKSIFNGTHPDVILVQPDDTSASQNISVAAIRDLIRQLGYCRFNSRHRFVIIEPADALMPAAANALLKTLEEPPDGTGLILITTDGNGLLPTIRSRCQRIRFGSVAPDLLSRWLADQGIENSALCARLSQGCPGEALRLSQGAIEKRLVLREQLLTVLNGSAGDLFQLSHKLCSGSRIQWTPRVETLIELIEELLRDVTVCATDSSQLLFHEDLGPTLQKWHHNAWPYGVAACAKAIHEAKEQLNLFVSGKLIVDALFSVLRLELNPPRA